jgi:hypothetical protein
LEQADRRALLARSGARHRRNRTSQGQRETAKLEPGSKSLAALRGALRPRLRPLRGLEGTAVAFLGAGSDDDGDYLAGRVAEGMVIPSDLRQCLAKLTTKLHARPGSWWWSSFATPTPRGASSRA